VGIDASLAASDMNLNGTINRDLAVAGAGVTISGNVGRDVRAAVDRLNLTSAAKVGGEIEYTSKNTVNIDEGADVAGQVTQNVPKEKRGALVSLFIFSGTLALIAALILLITAFVVTALFPQLVHQVSLQAMRRPWWVLLTGFIASIVAPIVGILLMITIIGIPLALLLLLIWILIAGTSGLFSAYYLGRRLWTRQDNPLFRVLLGGFVLLVLFLIPILGFLVMLAAFWMGTGMVLLELKDRYPKPAYHLK
jgi:hypothetical protein